ncbi:hypothetical protein QCA50_015157 [Cerrena zonata]|uniref:Dienelactone hydrolase domain-containing protein n=1 Tax=Cerrena zonata TaxID=2478898 RepID=A0AAW0FK56_9APHY
MSLCESCIAGVRHEGTPEGEIKEIGGIRSYVTTPKGDYAKDKVLLFLPDVFGIDLDNGKLLADTFAEAGYPVIVPDLFKGDPIPSDALGSPSFDFMAWLGKHQPAETIPMIESVIAVLKAQGVTKIAALGFCYGARPAFDLAFENKLDIVLVNHPSLLKVPEDLETYLAKSKAPLFINSCETDQQYPIESQAKGDEILGGGKFAPGYERAYWPGMVHGFTIRGDASKPEVKEAMDGAFKAAVAFLKKYY